MNDEYYMEMALKSAQKGVEEGQSPFGACIVLGKKVIACEHNMVIATNDATAHAEIRTIREACNQLKCIHFDDIDDAGKHIATIYSTTEPCPMCFSAIHWARIGRIVSGCTIADAAEFGFNELPLSNSHLNDKGECGIELVSGVLRNQCRALFEHWRENSGRAY